LDDLNWNEIGFQTHKYNGKSKGICHLLFKTKEAASKMKQNLLKMNDFEDSTIKYIPAVQSENASDGIPVDIEIAAKGGQFFSSSIPKIPSTSHKEY
jgi:hypothetical protein